MASMKQKMVRSSIKIMVQDKLSPLSIVAAHGRIVTPDEAELLKKYEREWEPTEIVFSGFNSDVAPKKG